MTARQHQQSLRALLGPIPVLVVLRKVDPGAVVQLSGVLGDVGIDRLEVTFDTPGAVDVIQALTETGAPMVAAGTVRTEDAVDQAVAAGASLILSPVLDRRVIERSHHHNVPVLPGVLTPTEAMQALEWGCSAVKLFPASSVGPGHLAALRSVLEVDVVPTGGIDASSAARWLEAGAVGVGVGSWLIAADTDHEIRRRGTALVKAVREVGQT